jgi:hypothetical protein
MFSLRGQAGPLMFKDAGGRAPVSPGCAPSALMAQYLLSSLDR